MADMVKIDIKHIAKLANLPLTPQEEEIFTPQLQKVLDYISVLQKVDTSSVSPTSQVNNLKNVTHSDTVKPGLKLDIDYFKVKAILDHD